MAQTDRQMRELSKERRLKVLESAAEVIRVRGLADTRISDIGDRAQMSPGHVMYYFDSKDELLMEAVRLSEDRFYEEVRTQLETQKSATGRITRLIELWCPTGDTHEASTAWVLWPELWARSMHHPELARMRESLDKRWSDLVSDTVTQGVVAGDFDATGTEGFAVLLLSLLDGLAFRVMAGDPDMTPDAMRRTILAFASGRLGFHGPGARKPRRRTQR